MFVVLIFLGDLNLHVLGKNTFLVLVSCFLDNVEFHKENIFNKHSILR
jgi:hypothetical protein